MARRGRPPKAAQQATDTLALEPTQTTQECVPEGFVEVKATPVTAEPPPPPKPTERTRLKIVVYAIARNESKFVDRWVQSMREADEIVVLDTGSTDDTVALLRNAGVTVATQTFSPFRFDIARNESMKLVPEDADILVCTDLDEYFIPGWREKLESAWVAALERGQHPTTARYEYVWNFNSDGSDGIKFFYEKVHSRESGAKWEHPVHEVLAYGGEKCFVNVEGMRLEHHADPMKSRAQYLGLLELSVRESPNDDRNMHYLGREYMFRGRWKECIETLMRHLSLPTARWHAERAASMRYIAECYRHLRDDLRQELWLWRAVSEESEQREACLELAELLHAKKDWTELCRVCEIALARTNRNMSYLTKPECWGSRFQDLYSIGLWYSGRREEAVTMLDEALKLDPKNPRLLENRKLMVDLLGKS